VLSKATRNDIPAQECQAVTRFGDAENSLLLQTGGLRSPSLIICKWKAAQPVFAI
jgi:hypothetical protein